MIIASVVTFALMLFVMLDLFLRYKNKKLKHRNEILDLSSKFEKEILEVKNEVTEQVFNDIASELHEGICQLLSLAVVQINQSEMKNGPTDEYVSNSRSTIRQALDDLRNLSHTLSGDYWKNFDIHTSIKRLGEQLDVTYKLKTKIEISPDIHFNSKDHEFIVIRILQELINNSMKHSKADYVELSMKEENENIHIIYTDNGIGFDETAVSDGLGMLSIKQRLMLLKASWKINSENHKGFLFESTIPLT